MGPSNRESVSAYEHARTKVRGSATRMPDSNRLGDMRRLRTEVEQLNSTVVADLKPFLNPYGHNTFERLPSIAPDKKNDIGVTVTCTCLMTLALTGQLG